MKNPDLNGFYREYLKDEAASPAARRDKTRFLARFAGKPSFAFVPPVGAFAVLLAAALVFVYTRPEPVKTAPQVPEVQALQPEKPGVIVKKVSSRTGTALVYQRPYENELVTIVWVFAGPRV